MISTVSGAVLRALVFRSGRMFGSVPLLSPGFLMASSSVSCCGPSSANSLPLLAMV
ncbi:Uncharacterised protein [Mycobacterium tuberculosis]|nr:Uncharacterised protein [Mycobacterium tuberculosis]